jgi:thioredoxin 1
VKLKRIVWEFRVKFFRLFLIAMFMAVPAFSAPRTIYPVPLQARADIAAALKTAPAAHKRVILDFGGNWCPDCIVLDMYLHNEQNRPLLEANYVLVHVNVGVYDANLDLAVKYAIPLKIGVPALAVLDERGKLLYSQTNGEFEKMGRMQPASVTSFLTRWKPGSKPCSVVALSC